MNIIPITQWSISKAKTFSQCKLRAQLQYGQKIPQPDRPLPPGKTEHANDRGTRIHDAAERFVNGTGEFIGEMGKFAAEFHSLRKLYKDGLVSLEGEWAHDKDWEVAPWHNKSAWLRLKLDAMVMLSPHEAVVIDYKSGKRFGNEVGHAEQVMLYQLSAFLRYPLLEVVHTELWYLDVDEIAIQTFTRHQGLRFKKKFTDMGTSVTNCTDWPANPNIFNCRYCPYGPSGTGHCDRGVA